MIKYKVLALHTCRCDGIMVPMGNTVTMSLKEAIRMEKIGFVKLLSRLPEKERIDWNEIY
jgi:hypothetical protein